MVCFVLYLFINKYSRPLGLNYVNPLLSYTILLCLQMQTFLLYACDYRALQGLIFSQLKATRSAQQPVKVVSKNPRRLKN